MNLRALAATLARNWRLKVAAFALALMLWALVQIDGSEFRTVSVPIDVQLNEAGWVLVGSPAPGSVEVHVSGPTREVFRLGFERPSLTIPINGISQNDTIVVIENAWLPTQAYPGVQVEDVVPSSVRLRLEREETRVLPVRLSTRGEIPASLALTRQMSVTPNVVSVTGPANLVNALDSLDIEPADLGSITLDGALEASIDHTGYSGLSIVPNRVTVRVPVEDMVERVFPQVPIEAVSASVGGDVEVMPATVDLMLEGARTRVTSVDPSRMRVFVPPYSLQGLGPDEERTVPVLIDFSRLPTFVNGRVTLDSVTVRRAER